MQTPPPASFFGWLIRFRVGWLPVLSLFLLEGLFLIWLTSHESAAWNSQKTLNQRFKLHPRLGYHLQPNAKQRLHWASLRTTQRLDTNKRGFRNSTFTQQNATTVLLGGAAVEPAVVDPREGTPQRLQRLLRRPVLALGVEGWHLQHFRRAWYQRIRANPKLRQIVLILSLRDLRVYKPLGKKPYAPGLGPYPNLPSYARVEKSLPGIRWRCLWRFCFLRQLKRWLLPSEHSCENGMVLPHTRQRLHHLTIAAPGTREMQSTTRALKQLLYTFRTTPTKREVTLVWLPSVYRLQSEPLRWSCGKYAESWILREKKAWRWLQTLGRQEGVSTLNVTKAFAKRRKQGERLFASEKPYLNARGHQVLAEELRRHLLRKSGM